MMSILSAILPLILIIIIFFLVVRIATVILKLTGLDEKTSRFQAISAFTGTGFTTKEAEKVLGDNMRRKTVAVLMILGKVGIVSVIASLFLSFGKTTLSHDLWKVFIVLIFIAFLYKLTALDSFSRWLNRFIEKKVIAKGIVQQKILEELFHLPDGYGIAKLIIAKDSEEKNRTLSDAGFIKKNILVLSIERKDKLIAFPKADDTIEEDDKLLCYGLLENIKTYA
ncbi:MAG: hypothetical protein KAS99_03495 [Candidatus Omnitrophica bacterium]|nr:hypothetical protein [Candidatus Omnitrophota bacterium]